jgi:hypothetical protein
LEIGSHCVGRASLEPRYRLSMNLRFLCLLHPITGIIGVYHHAWLWEDSFCNISLFKMFSVLPFNLFVGGTRV